MIGLIVYIVAAFGFAYVIGHSLITKAPRQWLWDMELPPLRWLVLLFECPACLGFWLGLGVGAIGPTGYLAVLTSVPALALAFFTAGSNYILGRLTSLMAASTPE